MNNNFIRYALIIAALSIATAITRFLPFLIFPNGKKVPKYLEYLSQNLPYATMALLVVYCLKDITPFKSPHGIPELAASLFIAMIHWWKGNTFLSIALGTIFYMFLVQMVFVG